MMERRSLAGLLVAVLLFSARSSLAVPSVKRLEALDRLWEAYTQYRLGNVEDGQKGVQQALWIDPDLAYANVVRAEFAMNAQDWDTSRMYFERGLQLLGQPDQPLSPDKSTKITVQEIEGDARCFLGYVYVKLAQAAQESGQLEVEQKYLGLAHASLRAGLALKPSVEARDMGQTLLGMFK